MKDVIVKLDVAQDIKDISAKLSSDYINEIIRTFTAVENKMEPEDITHIIIYTIISTVGKLACLIAGELERTPYQLIDIWCESIKLNIKEIRVKNEKGFNNVQ